LLQPATLQRQERKLLQVQEQTGRGLSGLRIGQESPGNLGGQPVHIVHHRVRTQYDLQMALPASGSM
jgi:hypothetical protein